MKIICTEKEKEQLIDYLLYGCPVLLVSSNNCGLQNNSNACTGCYINNIDWDIVTEDSVEE